MPLRLPPPERFVRKSRGNGRRSLSSSPSFNSISAIAAFMRSTGELNMAELQNQETRRKHENRAHRSSHLLQSLRRPAAGMDRRQARLLLNAWTGAQMHVAALKAYGQERPQSGPQESDDGDVDSLAVFMEHSSMAFPMRLTNSATWPDSSAIRPSSDVDWVAGAPAQVHRCSASAASSVSSSAPESPYSPAAGVTVLQRQQLHQTIGLSSVLSGTDTAPNLLQTSTVGTTQKSHQEILSALKMLEEHADRTKHERL